MSLFFSHFSLRNPVRDEKMTAVGHAVDLAPAASQAASSRFNGIPPAQSQPSTSIRILVPYYDDLISKEYVSKI